MVSSGGSASDYNADDRGSRPTPDACSYLGPPSLDGYWSLTGNLFTAEKGTSHPTPPCCWPIIKGAATCPSAVLTY